VARRWLDWSVVPLGLLLLAASFQPWYYQTWAVNPPVNGLASGVSTADAWQASSIWSVAVLLGVAAAVTSAIIALGLVPPEGRWLVRLLVVVAIVLGLALVAQQWSAMHAPVRSSRL
jgi:hypothetical protein